MHKFTFITDEGHQMPDIILIALGGNAIKQADEAGTTEEQFRNIEVACRNLAEIIKKMRKEDRLIITHGNGPQVGNLLVQQDCGKHAVPAQSIDVLVAMTQGQIGYMFQQTLINCLRELGINMPVCSIVNQVLVNKNDAEFLGENASKPVGNFLTSEEVSQIKSKHPEYIMKKISKNGKTFWRRCVPSPNPINNVETEAIMRLVRAGVIVIASGGGGIPVILNKDMHYEGVEAVIDKDLAAEKLAETVKANFFLILTDVEKVKLNYGQPEETDIDVITDSEAKALLKDGHFAPGSMAPKVEACIRFLEWGGEKAIITSLDGISKALKGETGTLIVRQA